MRYINTLLFVLLCSFATQAESLRGFLLTKDDFQLTGYFNVIEYAATGNLMTFTNDFGDVYSIHPMLVKGFGFSEEGVNYRFISRYHEGQWFFLRQELDGRALRLYSLPDGSDQWVDDTMLKLFSVQPAAYWFEFGNRQLMGISRLGFKKTLRNFFQESSPDMAARIGKKGYRYRDIHKIVIEYNDLKGRRRLRL
jgi:hypothetical protein